uniref:Glycosyl hydrolase family 109 protein n=1 Tax=uncultured Armatimonadetes bacterium TaxID=157466 RepID=A0A6J4I4T2_9BACT|nr:GH109 [uncultured Armatimonadetes bacterium]
MTQELNRRAFLQNSALAGAGVLLSGTSASAKKRSANEKLVIGVIGVAHQGEYNLENVKGENIAALCDVNENNLRAAAKSYPRAKTYTDYRRMLARKDLDAVVISTPDHTHAPATLLALETGRHVYCEKPLTHTVAEARRVAETARRYRRVTQMGTQIHASNNYRRVVELVQSGAIGKVREVHVWVDRVWSGGDRPTETPPVPPALHWNLWLGPVPERPYHPSYVPINWRGWWAFGGGTLGDMGCHHMDLPHWALDLRHPLTVEAEGPPVNRETTPAWLIVRYTYPSRGAKPPVRLTWYNGGKRPPHFAEGKLPKWSDGTLFVGGKGMLLANYDRHVLLPEKDFADFKRPAPYIPNSIGHHAEWIAACKNGGPTTCNFDYSGALTEAVLLGNVAYRAGKKLEWDPRQMRATNCPEADAFLRPTYRRSWKQKGLL